MSPHAICLPASVFERSLPSNLLAGKERWSLAPLNLLAGKGFRHPARSSSLAGKEFLVPSRDLLAGTCEPKGPSTRNITAYPRVQEYWANFMLAQPVAVLLTSVSSGTKRLGKRSLHRALLGGKASEVRKWVSSPADVATRPKTHGRGMLVEPSPVAVVHHQLDIVNLGQV